MVTEEAFLALAEKMMKVNREGYAGILNTGQLVDRRDFPLAIPVQENQMLGIAKPKKINWEQGIMVDRVDNYDKGYVMAIEDEDGYEYEGIGYYSSGELVSIEVHEKMPNKLPVDLRTIKAK